MSRSISVSILLTVCFAMLLSAFPYHANIEPQVIQHSGFYLLDETGEWKELDVTISRRQYSSILHLPYPVNYTVEVVGELSASRTGGAAVQLSLANHYEIYRRRYLLQRVEWEIRDQNTQQLLDPDRIVYGCSDLVKTQFGEWQEAWLIETGFTHYALPGEEFLIGSTMYFSIPRPDGTDLYLKLVNEL